MNDTPNVDNTEHRATFPKPDSRAMILQNKKSLKGLAPEEEGEIRGLFAHPDNPVAQSLVKNEYLASLGMAEMSDVDREKLRQIRVKMYKRDRERDLGKTLRDQSPSLEKPIDGKAELAQLRVLHTQAKIANLSEASWGGSVYDVILDTIADIPDNVAVYLPDTISKDDPSPLELFFLSKIRELPDFDKNKPKGAMGVLESMSCLRDSLRTKKFLLGVRDGIGKVDIAGKERIDMIDAGCGAIPILAIYATLISEKVHCTALELNPHSAEIARRVVAGLNLQDRIQILEEDATTFKPKKDVDFLISETMHSGLTVEPMVQIMSNLSRFVRSEGVILPNRVTVQAALLPVEDWINPKGYIKINKNRHHYVTPNWQQVVDYKPGDQLDEIKFATTTQGLPKGNYLLMLTSEVDIGNQHLSPYQSLITMPQILRDANSYPQIFTITGDEKNSITVRYKPGEVLDGKTQVV